jgi:hypothetical protein
MTTNGVIPTSALRWCGWLQNSLFLEQIVAKSRM